MRTYTFPDEWPTYAVGHIYYLWFDFVDWLYAPPGKQRVSYAGQAWPLYNWRYNLDEVIIVARKRNSASDRPVTLKKYDPEKRFQWANAELGSTDLAAAKQLASEPGGLATAFLGLAVDGFELSLKQSGDGAWMACLFGDDSQGTRRGLSARAKSAAGACAGLVVKWYTVLGEGWPVTDDTPDGDDIR